MRTWIYRTRDEKGMALLMALIGLVSLTGLLLVFLSIGGSESSIAQNHITSIRAFYIAEAGLERTKRVLKTSTASSLNVYLTGTAPGPYPFGNTPAAGNSFDGGNYIVRIYDNADDGDPNNDTDNTVFVEATGVLGNAQRRILALVTVPVLPAPDGAVEATGSGDIKLGKGATIDGRDWNPPADLSSCPSIATCGTLTGNAAVSGVSTSALENLEATPPSTIFGTPPVKINPSLSATPWNNLANELTPMSNRNLGGGQTLTGTYTWGTPSSPEITVISGPDIKIQGVVNGAGVLIIDNAAKLNLDHGTLNWQGLVIVRGSGKLGGKFENDDDATARIFGAVIAATSTGGPVGQVEIYNANSFLKFSSSTLGMVRNFLPIGVQTWREARMDSPFATG